MVKEFCLVFTESPNMRYGKTMKNQPFCAQLAANCYRNDLISLFKNPATMARDRPSTATRIRYATADAR
jgi:hypothetical protein